jgi:type IV secretory pathway TrbF-like protein
MPVVLPVSRVWVLLVLLCMLLGCKYFYMFVYKSDQGI